MKTQNKIVILLLGHTVRNDVVTTKETIWDVGRTLDDFAAVGREYVINFGLTLKSEEVILVNLPTELSIYHSK